MLQRKKEFQSPLQNRSEEAETKKTGGHMFAVLSVTLRVSSRDVIRQGRKAGKSGN